MHTNIDIVLIKDPFLTKANKNSGPPYDVILIQHQDRSVYVLEIAIAGFKQEHLKVEMIDQYLQVSAESFNPYQEHGVWALFLHKGLARRAFKHVFKVSAELILQDQVQFLDGILTIIFIKKNTFTCKKVLKINDM